MSTVMHQPLQDVSETILRKTASKNLASNLIKYRLNGGPRPAGSRFTRLDQNKGGRAPFADQEAQKLADLTNLAKPLQNML